MNRPSRRITAMVVVTLVAAVMALGQPTTIDATTSPFTDIAGNPFEADIDWLHAEGVTVGCEPTMYCPEELVTRSEMASFLVRMFDLVDGWDVDAFDDDDGTTHERDINRLAYAGLTEGCTSTGFCPRAPVSRGEMASFLVRAIPLTEGAGHNYFRDDDGTTHEQDIDRAAAAGITAGCGIWRYCPASPVSRGQMAAFLHRVVAPIDPPPHPAPPPATLSVALTGSDADNACLVEADPCRTVGHAIAMSIDGDTIRVGPGTFAEENLTVSADLTISGDPGGTTVDASGGGRYRVFGIPAGRTVTLSHLTVIGGRADNGGGIYNAGSLLLSDATVSGNAAADDGGGIRNVGTLAVTDSRISGNTAASGSDDDGYGGGIDSTAGGVTVTRSSVEANVRAGISAHGGSLTITDSAINGNMMGPGIAASGAVLIEGTTIAANSAGGVSMCEGTLSVADSTISSNGWGWGVNVGAGWSGCVVTAKIARSTISTHPGGSIGVGVDGVMTLTDSTIHGNGVPIYAEGSLTIANSTITANIGGVYLGHLGTLSVMNTTISGNTADWSAGIYVYPVAGFHPTLHLLNTIIAGNTGPGGPDVNGPITSQKASIIGIPAGLTLADILDPAGLANNGGPTWTIALTNSAGNPALDGGDPLVCAAAPVNGLDQRGLPRTPPCDIGAYEVQP